MAKKPAKKSGGKAKPKKKSPFTVIEGGAARAKAAKDKGKRVGEHVMISATALKSLLNKDDHLAEQISSLTGSLRQEIKEAIDKKGLDKSAFAMLKKIHRMSAEKAASTMANFLAYMDLSGENDRIEAVQELPLDDKERIATGDGGDEDDAAEKEEAAAAEA